MSPRKHLPPLRLGILAMLLSFLCTSTDSYTSMMNQPQALFENFVADSFEAHYGTQLSDATLSTLWGAIASMMDVGSVVGACLIGCLSERFGRHDAGLVLTPCAFILGAALQMLARPTLSFELLVIGRFLVGMASSLNFITDLLILESSPKHCRGLLGATPTFFTSVWICIGTILSLDSILGNEALWPYLVGFGAIPGILLLILGRFLPESPKFLSITQRRRAAAIESVRFYHSVPEDAAGARYVHRVLQEFELERSVANDRNDPGLLTILKTPSLRYGFGIAFITIACGNFSGIDIAFQYSNQVMESLGLEGSSLIIIVSQIPGIVFCLLALLFIESIGRRKLFLGATFLGCLGNVLFVLGGENIGFSFPALILIYISYFGGMDPVAGVVTGEVCPQAIRSRTTSIAWMANFLSSILFIFLFPLINYFIGYSLFLFFALLCGGVFVWGWLYFPETKGLSVDEVLNSNRKGPSEGDAPKSKDISIIWENFPLGTI